MAIKVPRDIQISEPLEGEDADRFVAYVENPVPPAGHANVVREADETFAAVRARAEVHAA